MSPARRKPAARPAARKAKSRGKSLAPGKAQRGLDAADIALAVDDERVAGLAAQVRERGGAPIGAYREPLSGSLELHRGNVDEGHVGSELRTIDREAAGPAPGIEHVHSRADVLRDEVMVNRVFDAALERRFQTKPFLLDEVIEVASYAFCVVRHGTVIG